MMVNQVSFVMKRGRLMHVIGFHVDRVDMLNKYVKGQTPLCSRLEVLMNVEMPAPFHAKYPVTRKPNGKFAVDVYPF